MGFSFECNGKSIINRNNKKCKKRFNVYIVLPDDTIAKEENYGGYGVFGGYDYFIEISRSNPELFKKVIEKKNMIFKPKKISKTKKLADIIKKSKKIEDKINENSEQLQEVEKEKERIEKELRKIKRKYEALNDDNFEFIEEKLKLEHEKERIEKSEEEEVDNMTKEEEDLLRIVGNNIYNGDDLTKDEYKTAKFPRFSQTIAKYKNLKNPKRCENQGGGCGECYYCMGEDYEYLKENDDNDDEYPNDDDNAEKNSTDNEESEDN